ncbi:hypothetical protein ACFX2A_007838 [Malus domestica]
MARSMVPSPRPKPCHPRRLMALRPRPKLHSHMHHAPSSPLSYPLAHTKQHAPVKQPASVVSYAAQVSPRPSRPIIKSGAFSPHFSIDLTFSNSNLVPEAYHPSTTQEGTFHPSSSNLNGEKKLVSMSHRIDEHPCITDNLGKSTFATHRDPMFLR